MEGHFEYGLEEIMIDYDQVAERCGCVKCSHPQPRSEHIFLPGLINALEHFAKTYQDSAVLYGGQIATPLIYGFKKMRRHTNDIDYLLTEECLADVVSQEHLGYIPPFHAFYGYQNDILCVFSCGAIHDWTAGEEFFAMTHTCLICSTLVRVCSSEYLIALKMRRGVENGMDLFGKDAVDILNLIAAPVFRDDIPILDLKKTAEISFAITGADINLMVEAVLNQANHVPREKRTLAIAEVEKFSSYLLEAG